MDGRWETRRIDIEGGRQVCYLTDCDVISRRQSTRKRKESSSTGGGRKYPAESVTLRKEELAFIKAISSIELSPEFLRELRKAMAASKKKKVLAAAKASATSAPALLRPSVVGGEARTSRDTLQLHVSKRKAEELSSSDCPSEPASRRPAPGHRLGDRPEAQDTTGEPAAQSSRQLGPTEGGLAYTTVVAGVASLQQPSGPHKSPAKGPVR